MVVQPVVDANDDRGEAGLPCRQSGGGIAAADVGLDAIEITGDDDAGLGGHDVEPLRDILTDATQAATADAGQAVWVCRPG